MKRLLFILFFILPFTGSAQSMFFDLCKTTTWICEFDSTSFKEMEPIGLTKNIWTSDSIPEGKLKWTFNEENELVITKYNSITKRDVIVGLYKYEFDPENGLVKIWVDTETIRSFKVGITSTGNYAVLMKPERHPKAQFVPK
ncbi:MAG: hypothetical protein V4604_06190 [Bacteroidota bacterium]